MSSGRVAIAWSLFALASGLFSLRLEAAQDPVRLRGRLVDARGSGVGGVEVALHRVAASGGALLQRAVTAEDGRFQFTLAGPADDAVYFVATRHGGELFAGIPVRLPLADGDEYTIVVEPRVPSAGPIGGAAGVIDEPTPSWWPLLLLLLVLGLGLLGVPLVRGWSRRRRGAARWALLVELAALEERYAEREPGLAEAERAAYRSRRDDLRARLRALAATR